MSLMNAWVSVLNGISRDTGLDGLDGIQGYRDTWPDDLDTGPRTIKKIKINIL